MKKGRAGEREGEFCFILFFGVGFAERKEEKKKKEGEGKE